MIPRNFDKTKSYQQRSYHICLKCLPGRSPYKQPTTRLATSNQCQLISSQIKSSPFYRLQFSSNASRILFKILPYVLYLDLFLYLITRGSLPSIPLSFSLATILLVDTTSVLQGWGKPTAGVCQCLNATKQNGTACCKPRIGTLSQNGYGTYCR